MPTGQLRAVSIIAIEGCNTSAFATLSGWPRQASIPRSAASATAEPVLGLDPRDDALAESVIGLFKTESLLP